MIISRLPRPNLAGHRGGLDIPLPAVDHQHLPRLSYVKHWSPPVKCLALCVCTIVCVIVCVCVYYYVCAIMCVYVLLRACVYYCVYAIGCVGGGGGLACCCSSGVLTINQRKSVIYSHTDGLWDAFRGVLSGPLSNRS